MPESALADEVGSLAFLLAVQHEITRPELRFYHRLPQVMFMSSASPVVLCTYHYDATDRLADCSPAGQGSARFFYQQNRLATQIQGQIQHTLLRTDEHLLAHLSVENNQNDCLLLATDQQQSVIAAQGLAFAYTPYGHRYPSGPASLPGFTGQRLDPITGHYLLGNGYRAFNPVLMRFNSPDSLSPFGEGGLNAYAYCEEDPVNRVDPGGHLPTFLVSILKRASSVKKRLLGRNVSQDSLSSPLLDPVESFGSTQVTTSTNSVSSNMSASGIIEGSQFVAPPPRPPKTGQLNGIPPVLPPRNARSSVIPPKPPRPPKNMPPPPLPPKNGQAVNSPSPPRQTIVSIAGRTMDIRKAFRELEQWKPKK
ncbi:YD repeat protein [Pseudomonas amygdali pv. mori]|uniref:YD repeat protein n=2 Tax=Pseudomonas amygdali TaxID=47877 RepID=A0A3M4LHY9_PSEA0|nr:YD repeat protein [Pseudomonas amygdali pv. mori]RMT18715.1 YD repeat protein [Pseudomonas amygdali pv. mori]